MNRGPRLKPGASLFHPLATAKHAVHVCVNGGQKIGDMENCPVCRSATAIELMQKLQEILPKAKGSSVRVELRRLQVVVNRMANNIEG